MKTVGYDEESIHRIVGFFRPIYIFMLLTVLLRCVLIEGFIISIKVLEPQVVMWISL